MQIVSVNIGPRAEQEVFGRMLTTAFVKSAVAGPIRLTRQGFAGDGHFARAEPEGTDHAVMLYATENYRFWQAELGLPPLLPGSFGEGITFDGPTEAVLRLGDVLRLGAARIRLTAPRIPCTILARRLGQAPDFPKRFQAARRTGIYAKVIAEGEIAAGDPIRLVESDPEAPSLAEFLNLIEADPETTTGPEAAALCRSLETLAAHPALSRIWLRILAKRIQALAA